MKRNLPYPLFLIAAIVLDRVAISTAQIAFGQSVRAFLFLLLSAVVAAYIIQYFTRDWHCTNFIVMMIPVTLITYRSLFRLLKSNFPHQANVLGIALLIVLGLLYVAFVNPRIWRLIHNPARVTTYFNFVFIVLLGLQVLRLRQDSYQVFTNLTHPQTKSFSTLDEDLKLKEGTTPDIYVIVLDGYARQDVLQTIYQHNNSEFIGWLEDQGFYVAEDSHSNYIQTPYTMSSFWNFDYLPTWDSSYEYARYLFEPIQNNRVFQLLDEIGYTTVSFEQAVYYAEIRNSDVYLSNFVPLNNFETLLLVDSPLEPLSNIFDLKLPLYTYNTHRQRLLFQLDTLKEIPERISGPKIVYAHILAPHPPFVFSQSGESLEPDQPFTLAEGIGNQEGTEEYRDGYQQQVKFINRQITEVIKTILEKSESTPIILLMSDHGPGSMFKWDREEPGCIWERTSNLYAILLPGHEDDRMVYSSISQVNSFRIIFNTYFGTDLPLLEDRSYLMYWYEPTLKVDITNARDTRAGCTLPNQ